ncbi:MAG TPA: (4Fe-4S)-binding protein [Candidatus Dormibacteraeota bacterium]|nr:(4Fe-4S)-binding protein [Candidatus Dormibacteraeota bacterium]
MRKVYRGEDIEVSFDLDICVHIGECLRGHEGVFQLRRRPWVLPDEADADAVAEVVERCPSGRCYITASMAVPRSSTLAQP